MKHSSTTRVTLIFTPSPFLDIPYHSWCPATLPLCFPPVPDYFHINSDPLGHQLGFVEKEAKNCVKEGIYIPLSLPLKEWIRVRTKLVAGELFTFRDRQDSCLPSAARLDSPEDQGKGKVGPRKVLFLQEYNFLQG